MVMLLCASKFATAEIECSFEIGCISMINFECTTQLIRISHSPDSTIVPIVSNSMISTHKFVQI